MVPSATSLPPADAQRLAEAFRLFNEVSSDLSDAYATLQGQVARLTEELAVANGELRRQYQEKAALTERLTLLLDALPAGVVVLDREGQVEKSNPAAAEILSRSLAGSVWQAVVASALDPTDAPAGWRIGHGDGVRRVALTETELDSAGGRIALLHDITHAHRLKAQAERNERLAAMGEMAASLAHQLRTPLAAALLFAGNLQRADLGPDERAKCATKTVERLRALERLIRDTLLFARGEVLGREAFEAGVVAVELARTIEPLARSREVEFVLTDIACTAVVTGNRKAVAGALTNLLENALQACSAGGRVEFGVRAQPGAVSYTVRDNGRGIDLAAQPRVFEPFYTTRADGTGLGLAIARGVARAHGGAIEVDSNPGAGALFTFTLPIQEPSACLPSQP